MTVHSIAKTPEPPYYAVVFTSTRIGGDRGYRKTADEMLKLAREQDGFLGIESMRDPDGFGIAVSYWKTLEAIQGWKEQAEHRKAQEQGKAVWYRDYHIRICRVEKEYGL
ncbi:MAG TPA: antibiotic biosynthesis monooxygenase [Nitrospiria bacterium]|nr:antibiotic biosynthesis monooxygenase [Nitrospiria bacterium]